MPSGLKIAGLIVMLTGISCASPTVSLQLQIGGMTPLLNPALIIFVPVIAAMVYLAIAQKMMTGAAGILKIFSLLWVLPRDFWRSRQKYQRSLIIRSPFILSPDIPRQ